MVGGMPAEPGQKGGYFLGQTKPSRPYRFRAKPLMPSGSGKGSISISSPGPADAPGQPQPSIRFDKLCGSTHQNDFRVRNSAQPALCCEAGLAAKRLKIQDKSTLDVICGPGVAFHARSAPQSRPQARFTAWTESEKEWMAPGSHVEKSIFH